MVVMAIHFRSSNMAETYTDLSETVILDLSLTAL